MGWRPASSGRPQQPHYILAMGLEGRTSESLVLRVGSEKGYIRRLLGGENSPREISTRLPFQMHEGIKDLGPNSEMGKHRAKAGYLAET